MKVLVSGSTGMVGSALTDLLIARGDNVTRLIRPQTHLNNADGSRTSSIIWEPDVGKLDPTTLENFDAVVHLAGENIASGRWTVAKKTELRASRIRGTTLLSETLAKLNVKPKVFVSASAIGYYGDRAQEELTEISQKGAGFLADLCQGWESATEPATKAGIRVVNLRIGVVFSTRGGALAKMLLPFELGAGGQIGSGDQFFSWITLEDVAGAIVHTIDTSTISGPVNAVAPHPVTNKEFTKALGKALSRPTLIPIPTFGLRLLFGEMADECLIASQRALPTKLESTGYKFRDSEIEPALRRVLGNR